MCKISGSFCMSCMWIPTSKLHKCSVCEAISEQMITVLSLNDALVVTTHQKTEVSVVRVRQIFMVNQCLKNCYAIA